MKRVLLLNTIGPFSTVIRKSIIYVIFNKLFFLHINGGARKNVANKRTQKEIK